MAKGKEKGKAAATKTKKSPAKKPAPARPRKAAARPKAEAPAKKKPATAPAPVQEKKETAVPAKPQAGKETAPASPAAREALPAAGKKPMYQDIAGGVPGLPLKLKEETAPLNADEKSKLEEILKRYRHDPVYILSMLQDIQDMMNYVPRSWVNELSDQLKIPKTRIYRIATFFKALSLVPRGRHICTICVGTTCHVRGAPRLIDKVERDFVIKAGETTKDGELTLETVGCVGACALGPLVVFDGKYNGHITTEKIGKILKGVKGAKAPLPDES
jgi:NADH-quinone oxidoreductase subunit E